MVQPRQPDLSGDAARVPVEDARVAIVASRYHRDVIDRLLQGAITTLHESGIDESRITVARVPGAWEIPLVTQQLAASGRFDAVICLGTVIRGETSHDQYINQQVTHSLGSLALQFNVPVLFGVLTCHSHEQAMERAGGAMGNKGAECARAAVEMIEVLRQIRTSS